MQTLELIFKDNKSIRVDKFLAENLKDFTRSEISKIIDDQNLKVNDNIVKKSYKLNYGDKISVNIPEPKISEIIPRKMKLNIVYEDECIIVIDKPQGLVVHPGAGNYDNTLVNGLLYHCNDLKGIGGVLRPGVIHRIDKDTSGILVFAKTQYALNYIAEQFKEHTNKRRYLAIIRGVLARKEGRIETFISRDSKNRLKFTSKTNNGKKAITNYKVLEEFTHFSLVEAILETGRTHQIRVHFADMNHHIIGDSLYGYGLKSYKFLNNPIYSKIKNLKGQMLHAEYLEFKHPGSKKTVSFKSKPNKDFLELLELIKKYD